MPRSLRWSNYIGLWQIHGKFSVKARNLHDPCALPLRCRHLQRKWHRRLRSRSQSTSEHEKCWKLLEAHTLLISFFISLLICVGFVPDFVSTIFWIFLRHVLPSNHQFYFWFESSFDLGFPCFPQAEAPAPEQAPPEAPDVEAEALERGVWIVPG